MRVLLDTNIVIHREANTVVKEEIGVLFRWLDSLKYTKCIHPLTVEEIKKHKDPKVVATFVIKLSSYTELKSEARESPAIEAIRASDQDVNSRNDTSVIKEVFANRVDLLITEDRGIHRKAKLLGIDDRVFTIDSFLEKVTAEHPEFATYKVLSVRTALFGEINVTSPFFNSFRRDYTGFDAWFNRKADETAYICASESEGMQAFLYLKVEDATESYHDIFPAFAPKRRLKIGTFKVVLNGLKLGERVLKIIFDNAVLQRVAEIYVTIVCKDSEQHRRVALFADWGFKEFGIKKTGSGDEVVLVRDFRAFADPLSPAMTFPYMSGRQRKFIVPIYPAYHTELLPDSILRTEDPEDFEGN